MTPSPSLDQELVLAVGRAIYNQFDALIKSADVSKEYYLLATRLQDQTQERLQKIAFTAAVFFLDDGGMQLTAEEDILKLRLKSIKDACEEVEKT